MLNLLAKDFKMLFSGKGSVKAQVLSTLFSIFVYGAFIAIETFIFKTLVDKLEKFNNATIPFLVLFLALISIVCIVLNVFKAHKLFFNKKDIEQLTKYPVSNGEIIASKLILIFVMHYFTCLVLTYPIFFVYGQLVNKTMIYYYLVVFYPILSFLFEAGIAMLLVYPFKLVIDFLKKHLIIQFATAIVAMIGFCVLYSSILGVFMELVINNNLDALFTTDNIAILVNLKDNLVPINFLADIFIGQRTTMLLPFICITLGIFIIGVSIAIFAFNYFRKIVIHESAKKQKDSLKVSTPVKTLIKKELMLLFKDSNNLFSFSGLLIIQPVLIYLIISSMNNIFSSGAFAYYVAVLPAFVPLIDILIIMLFTLIINQGANEYIGIEKNTIRIMKTIPVSSFKQILIKVAVPFTASFISLVVSMVVLLSLKVISINTFTFGLVLSTLLLIIFDIISLKEELKIRFNKPRSTLASTLYSYLLPILYFIVTLVASYFGLEIMGAYFIGIAVLLVLGVPHLIGFRKRILKLYGELEVVN